MRRRGKKGKANYRTLSYERRERKERKEKKEKENIVQDLDDDRSGEPLSPFLFFISILQSPVRL
jgi:hypothetical protein